MIQIIYELENREFDNALLLSAELKRRGYEVEIIHKATCLKNRSQKGVLIVPNCYNSENYNFFRYMLNSKNNPIINLQYEQVLSKNWEKIGYHNPKGEAKNAITLCWGNNSYQRLLSNGLSENNLKVTGAIHLDFLSNSFSEFYLQKNEIAKSMNLDVRKKWILYISSFTMAEDKGVVAEKLMNSFEGEKEMIQDFVDVSVKSREITLKWIEEILLEDENICFLYRLHPNEIEDETLSHLEQTYPKRFICVNKYSVKQWIHVSDIVLTWFSTSIIECFYAKKHCYILRPFKIPLDMDSVVFTDAKVISDYTEFRERLIQNNTVFSKLAFPINKNLIEEYYSNDEKHLAYIEIANIIEASLGSEVKKVSKKYYIQRLRFLVFHSEAWKSYIEKMYSKLYSIFHIKLSRISPWKKRYLAVIEKRVGNWTEINQEINRKNDLLKKIVRNIQSSHQENT
ncbi:surface carbohydrate biosynthesis protein [Ectobacillus sp. sgz5001026]|uniref:surface carbohydrate biosynthesis protein n=1 Tax=Ectobacillus sp. sgz5001026 TaxID=3242473 RepID=UPI0036D267D1